MYKVLRIEPEKCNGCLQCEVACASLNKWDPDQANSRVKVVLNSEGIRAPHTCLQCEEAWCMKNCPVQAVVFDPRTGAKVVMESTCIGCKTCLAVCPFDAVFYHRKTGKALKCHLCGGTPRCVKVCSPGALTYVDAT